MQVKLNPFERVILGTVIANRAGGNVMMLRMVRKFREDLCFTDDEIKNWYIKDNLVSWEACPECLSGAAVNKNDADMYCTHRLRTFVLNKPLEKFLYDMLKALDDSKAAALRELTLIEKFCYPDEEPAAKDKAE